jgi:hypothetical protein
MTRHALLRLLRPILFAITIIYFLIDAIFFSLVAPIAAWISRLPILARIRAWIGSLRPYPALALFVVPLVILEPVKPVGTYLIATGRFVHGTSLIVAGEILKLVIVERLFQINRDKLLSIPAFAWIYYFIVGWLDWLKQLPPWQALQRRLRSLKEMVKTLRARLKRRSKRPRPL